MPSSLRGSLLLMRELDVIARRVRSPLLVGPSRKRFVGEVGEQDDLSGEGWRGTELEVDVFLLRRRRRRRRQPFSCNDLAVDCNTTHLNRTLSQHSLV